MRSLVGVSLVALLATLSVSAHAVDPPPECPGPLDFEADGGDAALVAGTVVDPGTWSAVGIASITCDNAKSNHPDVCLIFDSANPTGDDPDLGTPNEDFGGPGIGNGGEMGEPGANDTAYGNLLIIAENVNGGADGVVDNPDDEAAGGKIVIDFEGPTTVDHLTVIDNEETGSKLLVHLADGSTHTVALAALGDNSVQTVGVGLSGVVGLTLKLAGSGGLAELSYCPDEPDGEEEEEEDEGCTLTQGFWKNHPQAWPLPTDTELCGKTWLENLKTPVGGDTFYNVSHQYIAARLNEAAGASTPGDVPEALAYLDAAMADCEIDATEKTSSLVAKDILDDYNNGDIGPGHCDDSGKDVKSAEREVATEESRSACAYGGSSTGSSSGTGAAALFLLGLAAVGRRRRR